MILFQLFSTGVVDTSGKFATGINDTSLTGGKFTPMSLISVVTCEYLRKFSNKFEMILMLYLRELDEKKPEAKNLVTLSF